MITATKKQSSSLVKRIFRILLIVISLLTIGFVIAIVVFLWPVDIKQFRGDGVAHKIGAWFWKGYEVEFKQFNLAADSIYTFKLENLPRTLGQENLSLRVFKKDIVKLDSTNFKIEFFSRQGVLFFDHVSNLAVWSHSLRSFTRDNSSDFSYDSQILPYPAKAMYVFLFLSDKHLYPITIRISIASANRPTAHPKNIPASIVIRAGGSM